MIFHKDELWLEDALKLITNKHYFEIPTLFNSCANKKLYLDAYLHNPDYIVYKNQPNFKENTKQLATKQIKEIIFIDQLAHMENITSSDDDIKSYLNFIKRMRTKEFIYFNPPMTKIKGQEMPLSAELLRQCCLREKTLNYIIHHLTRN